MIVTVQVMDKNATVINDINFLAHSQIVMGTKAKVSVREVSKDNFQPLIIRVDGFNFVGTCMLRQALSSNGNV
eukprot:Nk52_evm1s668 gene=Nk52_evmTU1s668